ncbi:trehalase family glycosidase [Flavobacterium sp. '19STA2R22 D10 B1']|uniref:trehalase family glycosidase n=1 Tax=Flavobacterium aerium TaxID=3037261 RepID=UPI00278C0914|nr:trehalase family glycosidase [Flavobacterium sp. '19STA2R22 D10 B1']
MKFKLHIHQTIQKLLAQEDTDGDKKITIDDHGPKQFLLEGESGNSIVIEGTYYLSNLLQELALMGKRGFEVTEIDLSTIIEKPVDRISRKIKELYWEGLKRTIDEAGLEKIIEDEKTNHHISILYVSAKDKRAIEYFSNYQEKNNHFEVRILAENITPEYVLSLNDNPGILALALEEKEGEIQGIPFVVPGGRFNEMYGWDSYFIALGLIIDEKIKEAKDIAENFKYQIDHYGKILNANRSYYLTRTQPPLYSSLVVHVAERENDLTWIKKHLETVIKEYKTVWMEEGKRLTTTGLNRYKAEGIGIPFEVEMGHFDDILEEYAIKYAMPLNEFEEEYLKRKIVDPELDAYFIQDRSMRESGHDTTNRLIGVCADLNTVAVNCFLYKYEIDIAFLIEEYFNGEFTINSEEVYLTAYWTKQAEQRKEKINELCWNEEQSIYFDYNFLKKEQHKFEAATTFFPLWAKVATAEQAAKLVQDTLPKFKMKGGIAGCTKTMVQKVQLNAPQRQWDYPFGWSPHQILLWEGLLNYGYNVEAQEMIYRWLWLITRNAVDFNGTIPEKFDLEISSHKIFAEYGNVGTNFDYITEEGFGWMNASYQYGLSLLEEKLREKLNLLIDPEDLFST